MNIKKIIFITLLIIILFILCIVLFLINWNFPKISSKYHKSDKYDQLCLFLAVNYNKPELCDKIYPFAYETVLMAADDQNIFLEQSTCYDVLADNLKDPSYCDKVKPINSWFSSGKGLNPDYCREHYFPGGWRGGYEPGIKEEEELLKEMGFNYQGDISDLSLYWSAISGRAFFSVSDLINISVRDRDEISKVMNKSVKDEFIKKATNLCINH